MRNILSDPDDCDPRIARARQTERDAAANRILIREIASYQSLIHDRNRLSARFHVLRSKIAPFDYRNAECLEIVRTNHLPTGRREIRCVELAALNRKWITV